MIEKNKSAGRWEAEMFTEKAAFILSFYLKPLTHLITHQRAAVQRAAPVVQRKHAVS